MQGVGQQGWEPRAEPRGPCWDAVRTFLSTRNALRRNRGWLTGVPQIDAMKFDEEMAGACSADAKKKNPTKARLQILPFGREGAASSSLPGKLSLLTPARSIPGDARQEPGRQADGQQKLQGRARPGARRCPLPAGAENPIRHQSWRCDESARCYPSCGLLGSPQRAPSSRSASAR